MSITQNEYNYFFCDLNRFSELNLKSCSVWSDPALLEIFQFVSDCYLEFICIKKKEQMVASLPVFYKKKLFLKYTLNPDQYFYYQISYYYEKKRRAHENELIELNILSAIAEAMKSRYSYLKLKLSFSNYDMRAFNWEKINAHPLYSIISELQIPNFQANYSYNQTQHIKKASELDLQVSQQIDIEAVFELQKITYDKKSVDYSARFNNIKKLAELLYKAGKLEIFGVFLDKKLIASRLIICDYDNSIAYDWNAASDNFAYKNGVNSFLMDYILQYYHHKGLKYYDFCGANVKSVARFKHEFGGYLKVYYALNKIL